MPAYCIDEGVSRGLARERAAIVSNVRYRIDITLKPHASRMPGHIEIDFDLAKTRDPLALDFRGDGVARQSAGERVPRRSSAR